MKHKFTMMFAATAIAATLAGCATGGGGYYGGQPQPLQALLDVFLADHGPSSCSGAHRGRQEGEARPSAFQTLISQVAAGKLTLPSRKPV